MTSVATSGLVALAAGAVQADDYLLILDVHDTTQAATGSLKKILLSSLLQTANTAVTVSTPLTYTQTWNDGAVTFTAAKINVTATASAAASLLLDLQVGGTSQWKVTKAGAVTQLGALAIVGALTGATTGAFSGAVSMTALTATTGTFSGAVSMTALTATTGAFSSTLAVTGVSTLKKVICGDGTAAVLTGLGIECITTTASGSGTTNNILSEATQTAATTGAFTNINAVSRMTHTSGTVVLTEVVVATAYSTGAGGSTSSARCFISRGSLTAGTVSEYVGFYAAAPVTGATITTGYAFYAAPVVTGTTNWALYFASSATSGGVTFRDTALATTATVGHLFIPSSAGPPTGVPASIPTGQIAFQYDSTNHKLYAYSGAWRSTAALT